MIYIYICIHIYIYIPVAQYHYIETQCKTSTNQLIKRLGMVSYSNGCFMVQNLLPIYDVHSGLHDTS